MVVMPFVAVMQADFGGVANDALLFADSRMKSVHLSTASMGLVTACENFAYQANNLKAAWENRRKIEIQPSLWALYSFSYTREILLVILDILPFLVFLLAHNAAPNSLP